jgi:hypothetical protein
MKTISVTGITHYATIEAESIEQAVEIFQNEYYKEKILLVMDISNNNPYDL